MGEDRGADIQIAKSDDAGRSFDQARAVYQSDGHCDAPKVIVDGEGTIHLVYAESPTGPFERYHIRYTQSKDGARTFDEPREISSPLPETFDSSGFPALSLDGQDNLYVLWELFRSGEHRPRGLGFTSSRDAGRRFASPSLVSGSADAALGYNGSRQGLLTKKLAVNGAGAVAVVNSTFKRDQASHVWVILGRRVER